MNKIATIVLLINEAHAIKNTVSIEYSTVIHPEPEKKSRIITPPILQICWTYHLPESFQIKYNKWKASFERFVYQLGEMVTLQDLRNVTDEIDRLFENGGFTTIFLSKEELVEINVSDYKVRDDTKEDAIYAIQKPFDFAIRYLNRLKNICEDELSNKVFVVHGHSELLIAKTESFLQRLGFEPIILRNQANQGQTIIEKLESYTDVPFAIVLYTACDQGRLNDDSEPLKPRARQNVVFEHGYLNAKLGRNRVCALVEEGVEYPGDLSGVVYIPIDPNGAWMYSVAKEMKAAGLNVDKNKL